MSGKIIGLKEWIMYRIESGRISSPAELTKLYRHYHRIRIWEAQEAEHGPRLCPERSR